MSKLASNFGTWRQALGGAHVMHGSQDVLIPRRISTRYPSLVNGADIAFSCEVFEGGFYYCKQDSPGRPARLTDWFCTKLAEHLGIATAQCAIIEDQDGATYFGSLSHPSTQQEFELRNFLFSQRLDELGAPASWLGRYFAGLQAFDLFISNGDRDIQNFVLRRDGTRDVLTAIDFASARLDRLRTSDFPVASTRTISVGRVLQNLHGRHTAAAMEMVDRVAAVPANVIEGIVAGVPSDWANPAQKEGICDAWSSNEFRARLASLRAGIRDGTLL